jgi:hypothetical protein
MMPAAAAAAAAAAAQAIRHTHKPDFAVLFAILYMLYPTRDVPLLG